MIQVTLFDYIFNLFVFYFLMAAVSFAWGAAMAALAGESRPPFYVWIIPTMGLGWVFMVRELAKVATRGGAE